MKLNQRMSMQSGFANSNSRMYNNNNNFNNQNRINIINNNFEYQNQNQKMPSISNMNNINSINNNTNSININTNIINNIKQVAEKNIALVFLKGDFVKVANAKIVKIVYLVAKGGPPLRASIYKKI